MHKSIREFYKTKKKWEVEAMKADTLLQELEKLDLPSCFNGDSEKSKQPHIYGMEWFWQWSNRPVTVSIFYASVQEVYTVLAKIRERFGNFYKMEVWNESGTIIFTSKVYSTNLFIQLILASDCEFKKEMKEVTVFDCNGNLK